MAPDRKEVVRHACDLIFSHFKRGLVSDAAVTDRIDRAAARANRRGVTAQDLETRLERWEASIESKQREYRFRSGAVRDLEICLAHTDARDRFGRNVIASIAWIAEHWTPIAAIVALAGLATIRLPYDAFFRGLGTTPEDAGLVSVEMLSRSSPALLGAAVAGSVLLAALLQPLVFVRRAEYGRASATAHARDWPDYRTLLAENVLGMLGCVLGFLAALGVVIHPYKSANAVAPPLAFLHADQREHIVHACIVIAAAFAMWSGWALVAGSIKWRRGIAPCWYLDLRSFFGATIAFLPLVLGLILGLSDRAAGEMGRQAALGGTISSVRVLGFPVLNISVPRVRILAGPGELDRNACYRLLGRPNDQVLLYRYSPDDANNAQLLRMPAAALVLAESTSGAAGDVCASRARPPRGGPPVD